MDETSGDPLLDHFSDVSTVLRSENTYMHISSSTHPAPAQLPMTWSVFSTTSLPPAFPSSSLLPLAWS